MKNKILILVAIFLVGVTSYSSAQYLFEEIDSIFTKDDSDHAENVHMPSIIVTQKGTVIAATQLRKESQWDWGHDSEILLRRSTDGGITWESVQKVYSKKGINAVNGPIVEDRVTGEIIYPFTIPPVEKTSQEQWVEYQVRSGGNLEYITSKNEGKTWSKVKSTKPISKKNEIAWPSNASHGIQLANGRLVIGAFITEVKPEDEGYLESEYAAGVMYSDDHGKTWHIGAKVPYNGTDEIAVLETTDGELYVNFRINNREPNDYMRGYARSKDGGETFYEVGLQDNMSKVGCHVGLVRYSGQRKVGRNIILYSGPYGNGNPMEKGHDRYNLILRASFDDGETWPISQRLTKGYAGYSDLAVTKDGTILCIYGVDTFKSDNSRIKLVRLSWDAVENVYKSRMKNLN